MGQVIDKIIKKKQVNLFMFGVGYAGNTSILYRWKEGVFVNKIPTIGFNIEDINYKNSIFTIHDAGGGMIKPSYPQYMPNKDGIIVVVDSSNLYNPNLLQNTLQSCLNVIYQGKQLPLLILANKKDIANHTEQEILNYIGIQTISHKISTKIIYTNTFSGEGLNEALEWLYQTYVK